jgi:hypothetical protein
MNLIYARNSAELLLYLALPVLRSIVHVWMALKRKSKLYWSYFCCLFKDAISNSHYTASCLIWPMQYCANTLPTDEFYFTQLMNTMTAESHGSTSLISPSLGMTPSSCPVSPLFILILCSHHLLGSNGRLLRDVLTKIQNRHKLNSVAFSLQANYTYRATAACQRS